MSGIPASDAKKAAIRASLATTKARRAQCDTAVVRLKIDTSKLSVAAHRHLSMIFVEAKWLYNWYLEDPARRSDADTKIIHSRDRDGNPVARHLAFISSQMKQAVHAKLIDNMKSLAELKRNGRRIGKLRFRRELNAIELKQPGVTFRLRNGRLFLQGLKHPLRVHGLDQLPANADIASAQLVRKPDGFFLHVSYARLRTAGYGSVAVDFGIKNQLTLSNGLCINYTIPVSKRTKRLQKALSHKQKGSSNRQKTKRLLARSHARDANRRRECTNKIFGYLRTFDTVVFQDDSIKGWHSGFFGKKIQYTAIGAIKSRLKQLESALPVERFTPTTKPCHACGSINHLTLSDRMYTCPSCGMSIDRDLNATLVMLAHHNIPPEQRESTPEETLAAACKFMDSSFLHVSLVAESGSPLL